MWTLTLTAAISFIATLLLRVYGFVPDRLSSAKVLYICVTNPLLPQERDLVPLGQIQGRGGGVQGVHPPFLSCLVSSYRLGIAQIC